MSKRKIGRDGNTIVRDMGDGTKISFTQTPAGIRANLHNGGDTQPVDPAAFGVSGIHGSTVGGDRPRVTLATTDGQAIDVTIRGDGSIDERIHTDGSTRKG